ncbi:MAG: hypothetical protein IT288_12800 [Bdellovibrionales bacterium]|nr:hypothetical protein [Bdellovibrionales bacterium]
MNYLSKSSSWGISCGLALVTALLVTGPTGHAAEGGTHLEPFMKSIEKSLGAKNLRPALAPDFFAEELAGVRLAYWNSTRQMKSARVPTEIGPLCIHEFKDVPKGNGQAEFCILRRWMILTDGISAEEAARRSTISDMLPHDNTMFADFAARLVNPSNCVQSPVPTTRQEQERLEYLANWAVTGASDPANGNPFWTVQIMTSPLTGERVSMAYNSSSRMDDGTILLTEVQGKASCGYADNAYSSRTSTTMVVPGRKNHLVYALSASCLNPNNGSAEEVKREVDQIRQFKGKIHSMYCEDGDGKFQILRKSLENRK